MLRRTDGTIAPGNSLSFEDVFNFYKKINFIYPSKEQAMSPFFPEIQDTWRKLLRTENDVFVFFHNLKEGKLISSISAAQYSDYSWLIQHATGDSDPKGVHDNIVSLIKWTIENPYCDYILFLYRPDNPWPNRIFGSLMDKISSDVFEYREKGYYIGSFVKKIKRNDAIIVTPLEKEDLKDYISLIEKTHRPVFIGSKGLKNPFDSILETSKKYNSAGIRRDRHLLLARSNDRILGYSLIDHSQIGINFSFFFNSFSVQMFEENNSARKALIHESINYYVARGRNFAVCLAGPEDEKILSSTGMQKKKIYAELIFSKIMNWYDPILQHFNAFYNRREKCLTNI